MKKIKWKKTLIITFSSLFLLFIVLCVHIYVMMKPGKPGEKTISMARIDFKQDINQADANKITTWLSNQTGVQHALCNEKNDVAVFSFYPAKQSADKLTADLTSSLNYKAIRYMPDEKDLAKSCPAMNSSFSGKVYSVMNSIF